MLAMASVDFEQMEFFPRVTEVELQFTKKLLESYKKMRLLVKSADQEVMSQKHMAAYKIIQQVEQAVNLILDDEVRRIIEFRFVKGHSHKATVLYFSGMMSDSTIDRKINKGIESIAESLKFWQ